MNAEKLSQYAISRMNNQKKTIQNLQNEIKQYEKRKKAFQIHLKMKDNQIKLLNKEIEDLLKRNNELIYEDDTINIDEDKKEENKKEIYVDPLMYNELVKMKNIIKDKKETLAEIEQNFETLQTTQSNQEFKQIVNKCREVVKENAQLYDYIQTGVLENLKFENGLEKSQIDQLMLKIKEKELINSEIEYEANEINNQVNGLKEPTSKGK